MELCASGPEDDPMITYSTLTEKENEREHYLDQKASLKNGIYSNVFNLTIENGSEHWYCNVCECPVTEKLCQHELGKRHIQFMSNKKQNEVKDDISPPETIIEVAPGEPLPPGFENLCIDPIIQERLDEFRLGPLVALEYLIELQDDDPLKEPLYLCVLCGKKMDPCTVLTHLASYVHISKYLQKHFPTCWCKLAPYKATQFKRNRQATLQQIAESIEKKFGRLKPYPIEKDKFKKHKMQYLEIVRTRKHFSEASGYTFVELIIHDELTKNVVTSQQTVRSMSLSSVSDYSYESEKSEKLKRMGRDLYASQRGSKRQDADVQIPSRRRRSSQRRSRSRTSSPNRRKISSPIRCRTTSPIRRRTPSPFRRRTSSPISCRTSSPIRRRTPSPNRRRTPSPFRCSPSFNRCRIPSPNDCKTSSPNRRRTPSPNRRRTPSPNIRRTSSHNRRRTPSPNRCRQPSSFRCRTSSPNRRRIPSPNSRRTSSPFRRGISSPKRRKIPSPNRCRISSPTIRRTSSPIRRRTPSSKRRITPSPNRRTTSSPIRRRTSSSIRRRTSSPIRLSTPSPNRRRYPPLRRKSPKRIRSRSPSFRSEQEKIKKMEEYEKLVKAIENNMFKMLRKHEHDPEKHPQYNEEWKKFWNRRYKEVENKGKNASKYDFKSEWMEFWKKRLVELHSEKLKSLKDALRKRMDLPKEIKPGKFKIGAGPSLTVPEKNKPTAALSDTDDVIIIEDKDADRKQKRKCESRNRGPVDKIKRCSQSPRHKISRERHLIKKKRSPVRYTVSRSRSRERRIVKKNRSPIRYTHSRCRSTVRSKVYPPHKKKYPIDKRRIRSASPISDSLDSSRSPSRGRGYARKRSQREKSFERDSRVRKRIRTVTDLSRKRDSGRMLVGLVEHRQQTSFKKVKKRVGTKNHLGEKRKRRREKLLPKVPSVIAACKVDETAIAKQIVNALILRGKTSVTQAELEQLINEVVNIKDASKIVSKPKKIAGLLNKLSGNKKANIDLKVIAESLTSIKGKTSISNMVNLSDFDLQTLLKNFIHLSTEEQSYLINYLKKLEEQEPKRVEKLRKFINFGTNSKAKCELVDSTEEESETKSKTSEKGSSSSSGFEDNIAIEEENVESDEEHVIENNNYNQGKSKNDELDKKFDVGSEDNECNFDVSKNVKDKEMEQSKKVVNETMKFDQNKSDSPNTKNMSNDTENNSTTSENIDLVGVGLPALSKPLSTTINTMDLSSLRNINFASVANIVSNLKNITTNHKQSNFKPTTSSNQTTLNGLLDAPDRSFQGGQNQCDEPIGSNVNTLPLQSGNYSCESEGPVRFGPEDYNQFAPDQFGPGGSNRFIPKAPNCFEPEDPNIIGLHGQGGSIRIPDSYGAEGFGVGGSGRLGPDETDRLGPEGFGSDLIVLPQIVKAGMNMPPLIPSGARSGNFITGTDPCN